MKKKFRITAFDGDLDQIVTEISDGDYAKRRATLVSVGAIYEDFDGPLSEEMIESAKRIIQERSTSTEIDTE